MLRYWFIESNQKEKNDNMWSQVAPVEYLHQENSILIAYQLIWFRLDIYSKVSIDSISTVYYY